MNSLSEFKDLSINFESPSEQPMTPQKCLAFADVTFNIFQQCCFQNDFTSFLAFSCANRSISSTTKSLIECADLMKFYPNLTIWDAEKQQVSVDDEPGINKIKLMKTFEKWAPSVEDNAGYTLLTMPKGASLNTLVAIAKKHGITVTDDTWRNALHSQGDVSAEKTYRVMIANGFLKNNFVVCLSDEKKCEILPTIQELLASEIWRTISGTKREIEHDTNEIHISTSSVESAPNCDTLKIFMTQGKKENALFITNGNLHTSNKIRACCKF